MSRCPSGKIRYCDRVAALIALSELAVKRGRQKQRARLDERRAYRCQKCLGWHLTSYPDDMDAPGEGAVA